MIHNKQPPGTNIVVDDIRFQNEIDAIHNLGGIIIKINLNESQISTETSNLHSSEKMDLSGYDSCIVNEKTVDFFHYFDVVCALCPKNSYMLNGL